MFVEVNECLIFSGFVLRYFLFFGCGVVNGWCVDFSFFEIR